MPAQARLVFQYFVSSLLFGFVAELELIETAQSLGERTQSLFGGAPDQGFCRRFNRDFEQRVILAHRRILAEFEAVFQLFPFSLCAEPWRPA